MVKARHDLTKNGQNAVGAKNPAFVITRQNPVITEAAPRHWRGQAI
jgi:hypothetical protein